MRVWVKDCDNDVDIILEIVEIYCDELLIGVRPMKPFLGSIKFDEFHSIVVITKTKDDKNKLLVSLTNDPVFAINTTEYECSVKDKTLQIKAKTDRTKLMDAFK